MKSKVLLVYGYLLPFLASVLFSVLPAVCPAISYTSISSFFNSNLAVLYALLAVVIMVALPFQAKIIYEDSPEVIAVLSKGNVRSVFMFSSLYQAVIILLCALAVFLLASSSTNEAILGFFELQLLFFMVFEAIAMISNGVVYQRIREKILDEINRAQLRNRGSASSSAAGR